MSAFDSFQAQMDGMVRSRFDHGDFVDQQVSFGEFCAVCACPSRHPSSDRQMGVFGVDGSFFCSMDCHDQHQCRRQAVVFAFVPDGMGDSGHFVDVACHGPRASAHVRCPECDFRSVQG